jgi:SulP family sulfate permease
MAVPTAARTGSTPRFGELFVPKLVTVLREGYTAAHLRADLAAGLTVAIVALPLSMAIAIASGVTPERGLYTAIAGGFVVSALGGSRFQIGGPAGAFIVLVAATVARHGVDGLVLATMLSGLMLLAAGYLRLGTYIKFIPYPVTVGFTAGIAVIIFSSQLRELFGLTLDGPEPAEILHKLEALSAAAGTFNAAALAIALATMAIIAGLRHWRPGWPGMLIAVATASLAAALLNLPVETIGTRFGGIPNMLPAPGLPNVALAKVQAVLPDAVSFALLGAIESLLSAVVADGMTGRRHRSNCELTAQGYANIVSGLFGGFCVTGTIARTATNVRAGAHGPVSGMAHSLFLLVFMILAAPLAAYIPLAALAGILAFVAWNMVEKHAFAALIRSSPGDAVVLVVTLLLVVFRDLTEGIVIGFALGALLFIDRMGKAIEIETHAPLIARDVADTANGSRIAYDEHMGADPDTVVYRISGAFFFGAASTVGAVLDRIADGHKTFILDCAAVPFLDSTAANVIESAVRKAARGGVKVYVAGAKPHVLRMLMTHGVRPPRVSFAADVGKALNKARRES